MKAGLTDTSDSQTTRRDVLAATLAATTATAGRVSSRGSPRGVAWIGLYNPTARSRMVHVTVVGSSQTLIDTQATVPPRAGLGLVDDILMKQTVAVQAERDGVSTVYQWDVRTALDVILRPDTRVQTGGAVQEPRELPEGGRVDLQVDAPPGTTGAVRVVRDGKPISEAERTFSVGLSTTHHDCLDATRVVTLTVQNADGEVTKSVCLSGAGQLAANARHLSVDVYRPPIAA